MLSILNTLQPTGLLQKQILLDLFLKDDFFSSLFP